MSINLMVSNNGTVDHGISLRRLETSYGLQGCVLKWFSSYVDRRTHFVRCGAFKSVPTLVLCIVPQGSVLGPILFLLYTADLVLLIQRHDLCSHLYADDTQIYGTCYPSATAALTLTDKMSACVDDVALWMCSNRLQLNTAKTKVLWCATSQRQHQIPREPTCVGTDFVQSARSVRDLGIYLSLIHISEPTRPY